MPRPVCRLLFSSVLKTVTTYPPPTDTFLKRPFLTDFKKHTHTPPPYETKLWCIGPKLENPPKNCEFAPCWHKLDVPERYVRQHNSQRESRGRGGQAEERAEDTSGPQHCTQSETSKGYMGTRKRRAMGALSEVHNTKPNLRPKGPGNRRSHPQARLVVEHLRVENQKACGFVPRGSVQTLPLS